MWRALAHLPPVGAWITPSLLRTLCNLVSPGSKKYQTFNLRSHTRFCYREKVVLPACASSSPGGGTAASTLCRAAGAVARASRRKKN